MFVYMVIIHMVTDVVVSQPPTGGFGGTRIKATGCGASKVCILNPLACDPEQGGACEFAVSISISQVDIGWVEIIMQTKIPVPASLHYVAIGFSNDDKMGDDAVTYCINPGTGLAKYGLSFNTGRKNAALPAWDNQTIKLVGSVVIDTDFVCHIRQKLRPPAGSDSRIWPLDQQYHYLVAAGSAKNDDSLNYHTGRGRKYTIGKYQIDNLGSVGTTVVTTEVLSQTSNGGFVATRINKNGCGASKVCVLNPSDCEPEQDGNCKSAVTIAVSDDDDWVDIILQRKMPVGGSAPYYIALGFSKDMNMGNDSVTHCISSGIHGVSFNPGKSNKILPKTEYDQIINLIGTGKIDSDFVCHIRQKIQPPTSSNSATFWPLDKQYYLLVALGSANGGQLRYHDETPIPSEKVQVNSPGSVASPATHDEYNSTTGPVPGGLNITNRINKNGCGKSKVCLLRPSDCDPGKKGNCKSAVTIAPSKEDVGWVDIMMQRKIPSTGNPHYIALGFSNDRSMGDDAVTHCINKGTGQPIHGLSFNVKNGKSNEVLKTEDTAGFIKLVGAGVIESDFICHIRQKIKQDGGKRRKRASVDRIFPLDKPYHLSVATGPASASGSVKRHDETPIPTDGKIQVDTLESVDAGGISNETKLKLKKAHGVLMLIGWWFFVTFAIFFARYFRQMWPDLKPCGKGVWFQTHRALNLTGISLIALAFTFIFIAMEGEWRGKGTEAGATHSILGMTCCVIAFFQIILAIGRPHPDGEYRPLFNVVHRFLGISAWAIAFVTIWYASNFSFFDWEKWGHAPRGMMIFFLLAVIVASIILEVMLIIDAKATPKLVSADAVGLNPLNQNPVQPSNNPDPAEQIPVGSGLEVPEGDSSDDGPTKEGSNMASGNNPPIEDPQPRQAAAGSPPEAAYGPEQPEHAPFMAPQLQVPVKTNDSPHYSNERIAIVGLVALIAAIVIITLGSFIAGKKLD